MDLNDFSPAKTGELVRISSPDPSARVAFIPEPLPPAKWQWPVGLYKLLIEASRALAALDGAGTHLSNPEILLRPIQQAEAQLSSKLEGTITDPRQQALFQADPKYPTSENDPANAHREVFNYSRALRLRLDGNYDLPLSLRLIRELHRILMDGVRGSDQRPGEFRTTQNQVSRPARYVPPPPETLGASLDAFERYLHAESDLDPLVRAFLAHYQFEAIHPFADGNGRVGRLLLALTIFEWCQLSSQWLYMSEYFEEHRSTYMDLLLGISTRGQWSEWLQFCLEGVVVQSKRTTKRVDRLVALKRDYRTRLTDGSVRLSKLVEGLFVNPGITVAHAAALMKVTYPTAKADLKRLEDRRIVVRLKPAPMITYYCHDIFSIMYDWKDRPVTNATEPSQPQTQSPSDD
jgi:Fic family protein